MVRLLDVGLEKLKNLMLEMADLSEKTVSAAIEAYMKEKDLSKEIFQRSEELRVSQDEVSELAVELLARYQPVASDLRFIKSCMEISYDFSRFGRYAYDISQVFGIFGNLSMCDKTDVERASKQASEMIRLSIQAFTNRDAELGEKVARMDDVVDEIYLNFARKVINNPESNLKCSLSGTLILRYLERIADHATYIGESISYILSGRRTPRM
jgi:phosphate transport system protein